MQLTVCDEFVEIQRLVLFFLLKQKKRPEDKYCII